MRTKTLLQRLGAAGAGAVLMACADLSGGQVATQATAAGADDAYVTARNHHLARRLDDAQAAYRAALAADPAHVNARNGLATVHAERREFDQAIAIWLGLTANATMSSGAGKAFLFGNLGYAYFLSGDYDKALVALEKACLLDPLNAGSWQRLGETLDKLGQTDRAQQMLRQASALRQHDLRADYAATGGTRVAAIDKALKAGPSHADGWAYTELHVAPDGMLELRRHGAPAAVAEEGGLEQRGGAPAAPAPTLPASGLPDVALLEIRNGNGVTGMARRLAGQMGDPALKVTRLTNEKGFGVRQTRVEYRPARREAAERLARRMGGSRAVEVKDLKATDIRLVLGRDVARRDFVLRPLPASAAPLVAAVQRGKSDS